MSSARGTLDQKLTAAQIVRRIERESQRRRGQSAKALIAAYRKGKLHEPCEVLDILGLAFLLPKNHPLHAPLDE